MGFREYKVSKVVILKSYFATKLSYMVKELIETEKIIDLQYSSTEIDTDAGKMIEYSVLVLIE